MSLMRFMYKYMHIQSDHLGEDIEGRSVYWVGVRFFTTLNLSPGQ